MRVVVHEWITGGGFAGRPLPPGLAREGGAMRRAVVDDLHRIDGIRAVVLLDARFMDEETHAERIVVPPGKAEGALGEQASRADFTLVIAPETGGTLARLLTCLEIMGARSMGGSAAAVALAGDKLQLAGHLASRGIATPATFPYHVARLGPVGWSGPTVVKPRDGAGSEATWVVGAPDELSRWPEPSEPSIVQPWIEGVPMSASFLVGRDGSIVPLGVARQSIVVEEGRVTYRGGRVPASLELAGGEPLRAVASVVGFFGFVGVDFIRRPDGRCVVLEVNPRLTTSYVGLRHLHPPGAILREWLNLAAGRSLEGILSRPGQDDVEDQVSFDADGTVFNGADQHGR